MTVCTGHRGHWVGQLNSRTVLREISLVLPLTSHTMNHQRAPNPGALLVCFCVFWNHCLQSKSRNRFTVLHRLPLTIGAGVCLMAAVTPSLVSLCQSKLGNHLEVTFLSVFLCPLFKCAHVETPHKERKSSWSSKLCGKTSLGL